MWGWYCRVLVGCSGLSCFDGVSFGERGMVCRFCDGGDLVVVWKGLFDWYGSCLILFGEGCLWGEVRWRCLKSRFFVVWCCFFVVSLDLVEIIWVSCGDFEEIFFSVYYGFRDWWFVVVLWYVFFFNFWKDLNWWWECLFLWCDFEVFVWIEEWKECFFYLLKVFML